MHFLIWGLWKQIRCPEIPGTELPRTFSLLLPESSENHQQKQSLTMSSHKVSTGVMLWNDLCSKSCISHKKWTTDLALKTSKTSSSVFFCTKILFSFHCPVVAGIWLAVKSGLFLAQNFRIWGFCQWRICNPRGYGRFGTYLIFLLHGQNFWRIKFTPKKRLD